MTSSWFLIPQRKKKIFIERGLEELERLRGNNESKSFYQEITKAEKTFNPEQSYVEIRKERS